MERIKIDMQSYKMPGSRVYAGRAVGEDVRERLSLDDKDKDGNRYQFLLPKDTMSINTSYFAGLWEKSVISLGRMKFFEKYAFTYSDGTELRQSLWDNINEGVEDALREF